MSIENSNGNNENIEDQEPETKRAKYVEAIVGKDEEAVCKPTTTTSTEIDKDDMDWICCECKEAECMMDPSADQFLICDGKCERIFHYPCAGLSALPTSDDDWLCKDCIKKEHQCAICHEYGKDDEDVFLCKKEGCGLFFHESCLEMQDVEVAHEDFHKDNGEIVSVPVFTCNAHSCWTCTQNDMILKEKEEEEATALQNEANGQKKKGKKSKKRKSIFQCKTESRIYRCLYCPIAYHLSCIPPTSRFHELALLCHEHSSKYKLPDLDMATSLQGQVEDKISQKQYKLSGKKKMKSKKMGKDYNPFFPGLRGDRLEKDEQKYLDYLINQENAPSRQGLHFCLPCDMKEEVHSKPPSYKHVHGLRYDPKNRPKKVAMSKERCTCEKECGEDCLNRHSMEECYGEGPNSNCNVGGNCGNRAMLKRDYVKCKPKREFGKGWGLVTLKAVPKGTLVQEYVGEVIDEREKEKRLTDWNREHPNDPNFYVMAISAGWYVDAREIANMSRFINHSCEPNCKVVTVNVNGYKRNGIYAIRDIKDGEFLSYDYKFDTKQGDRFLCRCGAKKCRGTMKGGNHDGAKKQPLSWKEAKAAYELDKKFLKDLETKNVISQTGALVPAAEKPSELVSNGPLEVYRSTVQHQRIFLWRNAKLGCDFVARNSRLESYSSVLREKKNQVNVKKDPMDVLAILRKYNA